MTSGRKAAGDEPINITASTKVTESERDQLIKEHGTMYAALRAGIKAILGGDKK
jgi:hypothetical protein